LKGLAKLALVFAEQALIFVDASKQRDEERNIVPQEGSPFTALD
jgi:hypothetical protein